MASLGRRALLLIGCLSTCAAAARADSADLVVRAVIVPRVSVRTLVAPPALQITERDLANGYVDAPVPLTLMVSSNTSRGVLLTFSSASDLVTRTQITGPQGGVQLGPAGGAMWIRDAQPRIHLNLRFRFYLSPATPPGSHPWPLMLTAES